VPGHDALPRINVAALLIACAILAGCREREPVASRADGPPRLVAINELSDAEKLYGHSAAPSRAVTYQPDVVMLPEGAAAIRGVSADGLVWTIDPDSGGAERIQPGKVLLATSRAVGRVLAVEKGRDGLRVVLGPVEITDVIRDGQFNLNQPVDFSQGLSFARPEVFDPPISLQPLVARLDRDGMFVRPVALASANPVTAHRFSVTPLIDSTGVGVRIKSTGADGVMFVGDAVLYLKAPELHFILEIRGGRVNTVEVELAGVAGLLVSFEAAMPRPTDANIDEVRPAFSDLVIPVSGLGGVPFAVNVRQKFVLKTAFTSTGMLKARGYYTLKGGVRAGYRDGKFSVGGPTGFGAQETLLQSLEGVAMGPTGMVMTHQVSVIVGLGAFGFVTGPYAYLNSSVAATKGSSIGAVICRQESVSMGLGAGVGYQMPEQVTNAINAVLSVLGIRERIQSSGGIQTKPTLIVQKGWYHPGREFCKI
jgi:hypothetical protein